MIKMQLGCYDILNKKGVERLCEVREDNDCDEMVLNF